MEKKKILKKKTETAFRKCSANRCSVKLSKIHWKVPVPESHLNIVAGLRPATLLRKRPRHKCFHVITLLTFKYKGARKFLMTF